MLAKAQQKPFSAYEERLDKALIRYDLKNPNYKHLARFVNNFKSAKKVSAVDLTKMVTGVCIFLDVDNTDLDIYPAIYGHKNGKVDISALRSPKTKKPSAEMKEYVRTYLNDWKSLGNTKTFKWLITEPPMARSLLTEMPNEHKVNSYDDISFIRGDKDWMYAISFGNLGIGIYAFKLSLADEEISGSKVIAKINEEKDAEFKIYLENYPFEHYTNSFQSLIKHLHERSSLSNNQVFIKNTQGVKKELRRDSLVHYVPLFNYLLQFKFPKEMLVNGNENIDKYELKHIAAHTLGDYYFSQKAYNKAIEFYKKAVFEFPIPDEEDRVDETKKALLSIAKSYQGLGKKNETYVSLIGVLFVENTLSETEKKQFNNYLLVNKEDKAKFRAAIDKALLTISKKTNYYTFTFLNTSGFFFAEDDDMQDKAKEIRLSDFYKSLK